MTANVAHPQAGDAVITVTQGVGVLRFTETVMQTVVKQGVRRRDVADIATCFRAQRVRGGRIDYRRFLRGYCAIPFAGQTSGMPGYLLCHCPELSLYSHA